MARKALSLGQLNHSALVAAVKQMKDCLDEAKIWMRRNSMCINDGKTQYLSIVPKYADAIVDKSVIRVGMATIMASRCFQCLGVCIDRHPDTKKQVSETINTCSYYRRNNNQFSCFSPRPTKNAFSKPLSHHGLTTVTHSNTARLQLTSPVYSDPFDINVIYYNQYIFF